MTWATSSLDGVRETPTRVSVPSTRALWLDEALPEAHADCFMPPPGSREFAHVHADGSMHLCVSEPSVEEILRTGWGEPHPFKDQGVNEVLFYAPRDGDEIELAKRAITESYRYAAGNH